MDSFKAHPRSANWAITVKLDRCIHLACSRGSYIHQRTSVAYTYQAVYGTVDYRFSLSFLHDKVQLAGIGFFVDYTEQDAKTFNENECASYLQAKMIQHSERVQRALASQTV
jgi:hypothetical protein